MAVLGFELDLGLLGILILVIILGILLWNKNLLARQQAQGIYIPDDMKIIVKFPNSRPQRVAGIKTTKLMGNLVWHFYSGKTIITDKNPEIDMKFDTIIQSGELVAKLYCRFNYPDGTDGDWSKNLDIQEYFEKMDEQAWKKYEDDGEKADERDSTRESHKTETRTSQEQREEEHADQKTQTLKLKLAQLKKKKKKSDDDEEEVDDDAE